MSQSISVWQIGQDIFTLAAARHPDLYGWLVRMIFSIQVLYPQGNGRPGGAFDKLAPEGTSAGAYILGHEPAAFAALREAGDEGEDVSTGIVYGEPVGLFLALSGFARALQGDLGGDVGYVDRDPVTATEGASANILRAYASSHEDNRSSGTVGEEALEAVSDRRVYLLAPGSAALDDRVGAINVFDFVAVGLRIAFLGLPRTADKLDLRAVVDRAASSFP